MGEAERLLGVSLPRFPFEPPLAGCIPSWGFKAPGPPEEPPYLGLYLSGPLLSQLVGTEDALLQQLAESMLKDDCASELRV